MAKTESKMIPLGTLAPSFTLPDTVTGHTKTLKEVAGDRGTLVMFICNHCPFVVHVQDEFLKLANDYSTKGICVVAISANDVVNYPEDAPDKMKQRATELGWTFPYLYDESQQVAAAYGAACTPDFFLFDENLKLVYRGQLDGSRPGNNIPVNGHDLRIAINQLLAGEPINLQQKPSIGCNIKWR